MEVTWWWLLTVPLFFGLGWVAAHLDARQLFSDTRALPASYFAGLNHLLNDRPEQAIASFEEVARLDPDTADLYFALGKLFRGRGEIERAIRIHRNLLERADLPQAQRELALFSLAQDYLKAGIFDRAESAFASLADTGYAVRAQRELARLYEKESNWPAAIDAVQGYIKGVRESHKGSSNDAPSELILAKQDLAHYACELAALCLQSGVYEPAQHAIDLARASDASNPRIDIYLAQLQFKNDQPTLAIQTLDACVKRSSALATIATQSVLQALSPAELPETTLAKLIEWTQIRPHIDVIRQILPLLQDERYAGERLALQNALADSLKQSPISLTAASAVLAEAAAGSAQSDVWRAQVQTALKSLGAKIDKPVCSFCGFKASRHHWRCPGCARWNTLPYAAQ